VAQAGVKIVGEFYRGSLHSMLAYHQGNHCVPPDALESLGILQEPDDSESLTGLRPCPTSCS
jgi:hypothetical protein